MMQNEEAKFTEPYNPWTSTDEKPLKPQKSETRQIYDPLDENIQEGIPVYDNPYAQQP